MLYTYSLIGGFVLSLIVSVLIWLLAPEILGFSIPAPPYLLTPIALGVCSALAWWNPPPDWQPER